MSAEPESRDDDVYERVREFIESLHEAGVEVQAVTVPVGEWDEIEEQADHVTDEPGPSYTAVDGVKMTHERYLDDLRARVTPSDTENEQ